MKKTLYKGAALLFTLIAASGCSSDGLTDSEENNPVGKPISLSATINNGAESRVTYDDKGSTEGMTVNWSETETFKMYIGTGSDGQAFQKPSGSNKFTGTAPTGSGTYYAVYPSDIVNTDGVLTIDLKTQKGTAGDNEIKEFMLATSDNLNAGTNLTFNHKLAVLKITINLSSLKNNAITSVSKISLDGLHNNATYSLANDSYSYIDDNKGPISTTDGTTFNVNSGTITVYFAVFPESVKADRFAVSFTANGVRYFHYLTSEKTLQAGKVVPVNVSDWTRENFKSIYVAADYKTWTENIASISTTEMENYLKAETIYWDGGYEGNGCQTFKTPQGDTEYHSGLWLLKKAYWPANLNGTTGTPVTIKSEYCNIRTDGKHFFLPAAGYCNGGNFRRAGGYGYYWSSTPLDEGTAYNLIVYDGNADVNLGGRDYGCLPMVAE